MAILNNSNAISSGGYDINNSVRLRSSASAYLNRTPASATNRKTWTWSAWVKRGAFAGYQNLFAGGSTASDTGTTAIFFNPSDGLTVGGSTTNWLITTQVFRDPSAWYHVVIAMDTTNATANNRLRIYINGSEVTAFSTRNNLTLNTDYGVNQASLHRIGFESASIGTSYFDGYLAEVNFVDGSAKTPSDFGETDTTTGSWKPKAYTGTYGTNGFYLKFSDIATTSGSNAGLGKDFSGSTNYWTTNNISVTAGTTYDAMIDSPTLTSATVANYATLSPIDNYNQTLSNGNLTFTVAAGASYVSRSTISVSSGKWYWEVTPSTTGANSPMIGIAKSDVAISTAGYNNASAAGYFYWGFNGNKYNGTGNAAYGATFTSGDVIGVALDMDAGTVTFYKNNTSQGTAYTGLTGNFSAANSDAGGSSTPSASINFGQRPFSYTPPTGFVALNTYNLPTPTILQGNKYMDATLYTGNGGTQSIVNAGGFKPDLVWSKSRSQASGNHLLTDSVRGTTKSLISNETSSEGTRGVTAFNSNGFTYVYPNEGGDGNYNAATYVGWQWQAGQGSTSSNTSGSITSTVSVNTTAGFSVATWTAPGSGSFTVGHGLGVAPKFIITKVRNTADNWLIWHTSIGSSGYLLFTTGASATNSTIYNGTPSATLINYGSYLPSNGSTYVTYSWAEIAGFSKFGSYTGNGSADGPFVYCGFRPKYIMRKCSTNPGYGCRWEVLDTARSTYNQANSALFPNYSNAEDSTAAYWGTDILSNGFKLRNSDTEDNVSGQTYIYAAFAENPFKNANAR